MQDEFQFGRFDFRTATQRLMQDALLCKLACVPAAIFGAVDGTMLIVALWP